MKTILNITLWIKSNKTSQIECFIISKTDIESEIRLTGPDIQDLQYIPVVALFALLGSHHQGSNVKFFVRFSIDMTIERYIRHYLEISLMFLYPLNLAISGNKVSLFQWTLSYSEGVSRDTIIYRLTYFFGKKVLN